MLLKEFPNARIVRSNWLDSRGRRFDCGPYMSGARESRAAIGSLAAPKQALEDLTLPGGLYKGKMIRRLFVDDANSGYRFLTTSGMLQADLRDEPFIAKKVADTDPACLIAQGQILVSAAGSIGRMAFVDEHMEGMFACGDILKISVNQEKVSSAYVYAFLGSKYGMPLVIEGTYGAIIPHLNSEHLAEISIPRFSKDFEAEVASLVLRASKNRSKASQLLDEVSFAFDSGLPQDLRVSKSLDLNVVESSLLKKRMDAPFHSRDAALVRDYLQRGEHQSVGQFCSEIFLPGIFKRIHTEKNESSAPYYNGGALFWAEPEPKAYLSRRTSLFNQVELKQGMVLVQAFGQEGGLTGKPVWVGRYLNGATTTHMLVRLICDDIEDSAYLFGFLSCQAAYRQIRVLPYGGSIPHFDENGIGDVVVPIFGNTLRSEISRKVLLACDLRDEAIELDRKARAMVEAAVQGYANE